MTEEELREACTFVLRKLAEMNPNLASQLTREFSSPRYKNLSKEQRKLIKVRTLCERERVTLSAIFAQENAAWAKESKSDISSFLDMLERRMRFLDPLGGRTGGNYSSRV